VWLSAQSQKNIDALKKAEWLVVCEIYPDETSEFWKAPGTTPEQMKQIRLRSTAPGASFAEKDGTFVNSARWLQWKNAAVPTPGEARLDHEILARIFLKVRELYAKEGGAFPDPIVNAAWNYTDPQSRRSQKSPKRSNGRDLQTGQQLSGFGLLRDDGSTSCGKLGLLRLLDRGRRADAAPRHRRPIRSRHLSQLGVVMARQPARAL